MKISAVFSDKEQYVDVAVETDSGIVEQKKVRLSEFLSILEYGCISGEGTEIGELPKGYHNGVIFNSENTFLITILTPAAIRPLLYYDTMFQVPFPALIFRFEVTKGNVTGSKVYALDTNHPVDNTRLYSYPYGNVYNDGRICWGRNVLPFIGNKKELDTLVTLFFSAITNDDLFQSEKYSTQRAMLMDMKDKQVFPKELLVRNGTYPSVGSLLNV